MNVHSIVEPLRVEEHPLKRNQLVAIALLAALLLGGCEFNGIHLPFGDKTSPYYWADVFLNHFEDELVVGELEPGPGALEEPRVVLLITGVLPERR